MKRMLSICLAITLLLTAIPLASSMALSQYGTVTGGWLRLRSGPSFDSSTVSSYYTGTQVRIIGSSGSWYQVEAPDGKTGYMYSSYISFSGGGTGSAYVTSSNGLGVRLRSGPGTGYSVLGVYSVGTAVTVLQTGSTWSKIQIGSRVGYMMNKFLTTSGGGGGSGELATVWSANGYGVRLRSGAGTGYSTIGVYSVGTVVTVLSRGTTWDYISVGSRRGYMMNEFLHYYNANVITAVTLNNTTPVVGSVLSAASITPSGATVGYAWYVGTTAVATTATYTVVSGDADKQIKLTVTGTGSYTGTATSALTSPVAVGTPITSVSLNNLNPVVGDVLAAASLAPTGASVTYEWYVGGNLKGTGATYTVLSTDAYQTLRLKVNGAGLYTGSAEVTASSTVQPTGTISAVAVINNTNNTTDGNAYPNVGDVLAAVPTPATATGTYRWTYSDDTSTLLSASSQLTLTTAMAGRQLTVTVTGSGNYSGTQSATSGTVVNKPNITSLTLNDSAPKYDPSGSNTLVATVMSSTTNVTASCRFEWYRGATVVGGATTSTYTLSADDRGKIITVKAIANSASSYAGTLSRSTTATVKQRLTATAITGSSGGAGHVVVTDVLTPSLDGGGTTANTVNANYTWTLNGANTATLSYTVPAGDVVGKTLTLTVTGKGDYYTDTPLTATATVDAKTITAVTLPVAAPVAGNPYSVTITPSTALVTYSWVGYAATYSGSTITVSALDIGHTITLTVTPGQGYTGDPSVLVQTTASVAPKTFSATFHGTFAEGQVVSVNTDLPTDSIQSIDWYLDTALYHSGTEKNMTLPTGSAGKEVSAIVTGKNNYTGSTVTIPGVLINNDPGTAIVFSAMLYSDPSSDPSLTDTSGTPTETTTGTETTTTGTETTTTGTETTTTGTETTATDTGTASASPTVTDPTPTPVVYGVTLGYSTSDLAAGTIVTAYPSPTTGVLHYEWYLSGTLLSSNYDLPTYLVTEDDLLNESTLQVIIYFEGDPSPTATVSVTLKLPTPTDSTTP